MWAVNYRNFFIKRMKKKGFIAQNPEKRELLKGNNNKKMKRKKKNLKPNANNISIYQINR